MARLTLTLLAAVLCGCSASGGVLPSKSGTASNVTAKTTEGAQRRTADDNVGIYLQTLHDLIEGDSVTQIDAFSAQVRRRPAHTAHSHRRRPTYSLFAAVVAVSWSRSW